MSVSTTNSSMTFAGGQSVLTFNFRALTAFPQYINVSVVALTGGTVTPLVYGSQYTVSISSNGVGGTVTVSPTYGSDYNYFVFRKTAILQSSSYSDYNTFPASTFENNLDQLTMIEQENNASSQLLFSYQIGTSSTYSTLIPVPSIGTVLGTDPTGTMFINVPPPIGPIGPSGSGITLVSSATTDISITSTLSSATITSVNAGTGGSNSILRLTSSGLIPALSGILLTNLPISVLSYTSNTGSSTAISSSSLKICYGAITVSGNRVITNLPFSNSNYVVFTASLNVTSSTLASCNVNITSASSFTMYDNNDGSGYSWIAMGT